VLRAFTEFMTTSEDLLGWTFVLQQWRPGTPENSLFALLYRIQVGRDPWTEEAALTHLNGLNTGSVRKFLHLPTDEEFAESSIPIQLVESIQKAMPLKLEGFRRIARLRYDQDRGWVRTFNKVKHLLLAFPTTERGKPEVFLPARFTISGLPLQANIEAAWLAADVETVKYYAGNALAGQLALHDTLAAILQVRFGEPYVRPAWVTDALQSGFWRDGPP
jgi:hypothetical protein